MKELCCADVQWKHHAARPECGNDRLHEVWPRAPRPPFFFTAAFKFLPLESSRQNLPLKTSCVRNKTKDYLLKLSAACNGKPISSVKSANGIKEIN